MRLPNRHVAPLILVSALVSGCTTGSDPVPSETHPHLDAPSQAPDDTAAFPLLKPNPCEHPYNPNIKDSDSIFAHAINDDAKKSAAACIRMMTTGRVIMVDFAHLSKPVEERLARDSTATMAAVTSGKVTMKYSFVAASPTAQKEFDQRNNKKGCDDLYDLDGTQASTIAIKTMPELSRFDLVAGVTSLASCQGTGDIKGAGAAYEGRRSIEVFSVPTALPKPAVTKTLGGGGTMTIIPPYEADTLVHESLHGLAIGHANTLMSSVDQDTIAAAESDAMSKGTFITFNLDTVIRRGQYNEYGDNTSIQGSASVGVGYQHDHHYPWLNAIHMNELDWAKRALDLPQSQHERSITANGVTLDTARTLDFATLKLPRSYKSSDMKKGAFSSTTEYGAAAVYDTLAIVPLPSNSNTPPDFMTVSLYLMSKTNDTLLISTIYSSQSMEVTVGKQKLTIRMAKTTATVSVK